MTKKKDNKRNQGKWWEDESAYRLPYKDIDFMMLDELRPVRLQLELMKPEMILADEPVASLDPVLAHSILGNLERINQEDKMTVICSLHFLDLVQRYATRVIGLRDGVIVFEGDSQDIRQLSDERFKEIYGEEAERLSA